MSMESHNLDRDPRTYIAREGFFTARPNVLQEHIWKMGLPPAAERVYFLHWMEGNRTGDWCSEIPLKEVAARCVLDVSTVTKAYQLLMQLDLIRRDSTRRDPNNRFQQAVAITEVRVPRPVLTELARMPKRPRGRRHAPENGSSAPSPVSRVDDAPSTQASAPAAAPVTEDQLRLQRAVIRKLAGEDSRAFMAALDGGKTSMSFSPSCSLNEEERRVVTEALEVAAAAPKKRIVTSAPSVPPAAKGPSSPVGPRMLSLMERARLQSKVMSVVPGPEATEMIRQVAWSVQNGSLRTFPFFKALNTAAKLIREGAWTRPLRMPANWTCQTATHETCRAA